MESYEVLKEVLSKPGIKAAAADLNLSASLLYKWCQPQDSPDAGGADNPLDRIAKIYETTNNRAPIEWLCQKMGGFFTKNPEISTTGKDPHALKATQNILNEFAQLLEVVSTSLEDDEEIDIKESKNIRQSWENLKVNIESFVVACEKGVYRTKK